MSENGLKLTSFASKLKEIVYFYYEPNVSVFHSVTVTPYRLKNGQRGSLCSPKCQEMLGKQSDLHMV